MSDKEKENDKYIYIKGARVNNLKGVDVVIPRGSLVVVTGLSGSGKSSLAFDTLYAEGRRRYVESLSAYARQFMGRLSKPEADRITGLPPAIAIEQKVSVRNPRSTVGTSTEIYDYLRLLFARAGHTFSPISGAEVKKHTVEDVLTTATSYPEGTRIAVTAPIIVPDGRTLAQQLDIYLSSGYSRLVTDDGRFVQISDIIAGTESPSGRFSLLVDRLSVANDGDEFSRLADSVETAFFEGHDRMHLMVWEPDSSEVKTYDFSRSFEADGISFTEPSEQLFNFNNPVGACPKCEGFGKVLGIDERLVIPDQSLSVFEDAVAPWRGEKMSEWKRDLIRVASANKFPIHRPYRELTPEQRSFLWHGNTSFPGIDGFFKMVEQNLYKIQYRVMLAHYRGKTVCPECHGSRLRKEADYIKVGGRTITELVSMTVSNLIKFFDELELDERDATIADRLLKEIRSRLQFLDEVGLGYLTLDRLSSTLSGGESQRINLATSLGSSLVGSLYILDEPSIGLHSRDSARLIGVMRRLCNLGNTVVVVEHDEEIMRAADYIVDVGPDAGSGGGTIVYQGPVAEIESVKDSYTADYLTGRRRIDIPKVRRRSSGYIEVKGAQEHNLKKIDVRFPLGVMTAVTGVSGSGKSTLVRDILYRALSRRLGLPGDAPGAFDTIAGDVSRIHTVELVDQNPIGRSSRSNPATYIKAFDDIRRLFADQAAARQLGLTPAHFSFNTDGGRCPECRGEGSITVEMQFMADITIPCPECHGSRFKPDVLTVRYKGLTISDVLDLTVDNAIKLFSEEPSTRRIADKLQPLADVGLGYLRLGQSSSTLSGGESQRIKLASFIAAERPEPTLFIFDEPTTGLHTHDIATLLKAFDRLIACGHTIVVVEHNVHVILASDHVIDIGPEGGDAGGSIVASGTPEQVAACAESLTGQAIAKEIQSGCSSIISQETKINQN